MTAIVLVFARNEMLTLRADRRKRHMFREVKAICRRDRFGHTKVKLVWLRITEQFIRRLVKRPAELFKDRNRR